MALITNPSYTTIAATRASSALLLPLPACSKTGDMEIALAVYKPTPFDIVFTGSTVLLTEGAAVANPLAWLIDIYS